MQGGISFVVRNVGVDAALQQCVTGVQLAMATSVMQRRPTAPIQNIHLRVHNKAKSTPMMMVMAQVASVFVSRTSA